ncbi:hypothetical protein CK203_046508 [Vitis vinifera]|uniref:Uncharacterized protein n=1 Tax=Vitis vinifera TaxID=29760 RepID=A0A438ILQ0_VITVI|nr:hypothetical protein CK203_046508 [Vitis vinifera]
MYQGSSSDCRRVSYSSNVDNMVLEENQASGTSFEDDSDDCEFEEVRCELGVVEGQLCNIPFELYDLPDLREILSLDTWNSCLTEDERQDGLYSGTDARLQRCVNDGLPMLGKDSATILPMFHNILEKETPSVVPMVTKVPIGGQCHHLVPGPCTHIAGQRGGRCALNDMNVAGRVGLAPPAFPKFVIDVVVASVA